MGIRIQEGARKDYRVHRVAALLRALSPLLVGARTVAAAFRERSPYFFTGGFVLYLMVVWFE